MDGRANIAVGALILIIGLGVTIFTLAAAQGGGTYVVAYGAIIVGAVQVIRGFSQLGEEKEAASSTVAIPARMIGGSFTAEDYPAEALRDNAEGRVTIGFFVDEQGQVTHPSIVESSGHHALDDAAVEVLSGRYTFEPARNGLGEPIAEYHERSVNWRLPPE